MERAMKKTLKLGFGRRPQVNSNFVVTISSIYVNIKLHTKNQPPSLGGFPLKIMPLRRPTFWIGLSFGPSVAITYFHNIGPEMMHPRKYTWQPRSWVPEPNSILRQEIIKVNQKTTIGSWKSKVSTKAQFIRFCSFLLLF